MAISLLYFDGQSAELHISIEKFQNSFSDLTLLKRNKAILLLEIFLEYSANREEIQHIFLTEKRNLGNFQEIRVVFQRKNKV